MTTSTVLVVDDLPEDRDLVRTVLEPSGYEVLEAASAADALEIVRSRHLDLVISDIFMPGIDGYEFAGTLRSDASLRSPAILFFSVCAAESEAAERAVPFGGCYLLSKPAEPAQILAAVRDVIAAGPRARAARVLVVDDDVDTRALVTFLLRASGYRALVAAGGREAVEAARLELPDLVLMDILMPGMNGFAAVRLIKGDAALTDIPVVALTARAGIGDESDALAGGFDGFIAKPILPESFVEAVERHLPAELRLPAREEARA